MKKRGISKSVHILTSVLYVTLLLANSCTNDSHSKGPDVSDVPVTLHIQRFEQDLFQPDTAHWEANFQQLAQRYPEFLPFFITEVAHDPTRPDETPMKALQGFIRAPQIRRLNDTCQQVFANFAQTESALKKICQYGRYYFPNRPTPTFVTAVTEFVGDAYMLNDSLMMLGLDMFLGESFTGYNPDMFPAYLRRQFNQTHLPAKVSLAWATRLAGQPNGDRILDHMIHNGKILHIMDLLAPNVPDSVKMGYTRAQMEGCYANEQVAWARLLEIKALYEPLGPKNQKIVMPAPDAAIVFQEAPGEVGNWLGWQIVRAWLARHPKATVQDLLAEKDAQKLLEAAKYKPKVR